MGRTPFLFLFTLLSGLCFLGGVGLDLWTPTMAAESVSRGSLSAQQIEEIKDHFQKIRGSNPVLASQSAGQLGSFPYREVADVLLEALENQMRTSSSPNTYIVEAALGSLGRVAYKDQLQALTDLMKQESTSHFSRFPSNRRSQIEMGLSMVVRNCSSRSKPGSIYPEVQLSPGQEHLVLVHEMMQKAGVHSDGAIQNFLDGLARNHHDEAIAEVRTNGSVLMGWGREQELDRLYQALSRDSKFHVLLTGEAGVGKTTLVGMLQKAWISKAIPGLGPKGEIPVILELPITDVTNPTDPTRLMNQVKAAKLLARVIKRHVILYIDEAHVSTGISRNALKAKLTEEILPEEGVHFIWSTTSQEGRDFLGDSAFSRRWTKIFVPEFSSVEAIEAVKAYHFPKWRIRHQRNGIAFKGVSPNAFEVGLKYSRIEQPHAGQPTGLKEILDGAIVWKLNRLDKRQKSGPPLEDKEREFIIEPGDIRGYLKDQKNIKLLPGDESFERDFESLWEEFDKRYLGNEGLKVTYKTELRQFFQTLTPTKLMARVLFGPSGSGKTFLVQELSRVFFNNKPCSLSGAEYTEGGIGGMNKLIGSPPGTVGSEEQRSILTKYIEDNPQGGIILVDEAHLIHADIIKLFADMITEKKMTDGLNQTFNMSRYIFVFTSNIGQGLMMAEQNGDHRITWNELEMRRRALLEPLMKNGKTLMVIQKEKLEGLMDEFLNRIATDSNPGKDSSGALEDLAKLKRRIDSDYVFPPTREDLVQVTHLLIEEYISTMQREYGIHFEVDQNVFEEIVDLDAMNFREGFSFVEKQLDQRLFIHLNQHLSRGGTYRVSLDREDVRLGKKNLQGLVLVVEGPLGDSELSKMTGTGGGLLSLPQGPLETRYSLGISRPLNNNPWYNDRGISQRIKDFPKLMASRIMEKEERIAEIHSMIKRKRLDWNARIVLTELGTSGNGKTELGYAISEVLFGDRKAAFRLSGITDWGSLNNHFRSDVGFVGSTEATECEKWFMARKTLGGGVFILDEILSFHGLSRERVGAKIDAINKLYDMLDEGGIRFGGRIEDARGFILLLTGNSLQELFNIVDDSPEAEKLVKRILKDISSKTILDYFSEIGIDPPKVARFGSIHINGPLSKKGTHLAAMKDVRKSIESATRELQSLYDITVDIDPEIVRSITDRVTTVRLGMRRVNAAIHKIITEPITGILSDLEGTEKIQAQLKDGRVLWFADGEPVDFVEEKDLDGISNRQWEARAESKDKTDEGPRVVTPQIRDVEEEPKLTLTEGMKYRTAVHEFLGHWLTAFLLTGKNRAESINITPDDDSLGRVIAKLDREPYDGAGLISSLIDILRLEAGHRALFVEGFYSFGGGSHGRQEPGSKKKRTDDLGKIDEILDAILSNQIFEDFTEFSPGGAKGLFKSFMRSVSKQATDHLIRYGNQLKVFQPLFEQLLREGFLSSDSIEAFLGSTDLTSIRGSDQLLMESVSKATVAVVQEMDQDPYRRTSEKRIIRKLSTQLIERLAEELRATQKLEGVKGKSETDLGWLTRMRDEALQGINPPESPVRLLTLSDLDGSKASGAARKMDTEGEGGASSSEALICGGALLPSSPRQEN